MFPWVFICGLSIVGLADSFINTSGVFTKMIVLAGDRTR